MHAPGSFWRTAEGERLIRSGKLVSPPPKRKVHDIIGSPAPVSTLRPSTPAASQENGGRATAPSPVSFALPEPGSDARLLAKSPSASASVSASPAPALVPSSPASPAAAASGGLLRPGTSQASVGFDFGSTAGSPSASRSRFTGGFASFDPAASSSSTAMLRSRLRYSTYAPRFAAGEAMWQSKRGRSANKDVHGVDRFRPVRTRPSNPGVRNTSRVKMEGSLSVATQRGEPRFNTASITSSPRRHRLTRAALPERSPYKQRPMRQLQAHPERLLLGALRPHTTYSTTVKISNIGAGSARFRPLPSAARKGGAVSIVHMPGRHYCLAPGMSARLTVRVRAGAPGSVIEGTVDVEGEAEIFSVPVLGEVGDVVDVDGSGAGGPCELGDGDFAEGSTPFGLSQTSSVLQRSRMSGSRRNVKDIVMVPEAAPKVRRRPWREPGFLDDDAGGATAGADKEPAQGTNNQEEEKRSELLVVAASDPVPDGFERIDRTQLGRSASASQLQSGDGGAESDDGADGDDGVDGDAADYLCVRRACSPAQVANAELEDQTEGEGASASDGGDDEGE